jgi:hypothetical protein
MKRALSRGSQKALAHVRPERQPFLVSLDVSAQGARRGDRIHELGDLVAVVRGEDPEIPGEVLLGERQRVQRDLEASVVDLPDVRELSVREALRRRQVPQNNGVFGLLVIEGEGES